MVMLTDLADAARKSGLKVVEQPGWRTAGHDQMTGIRSITLHHTAGPSTGDAPSLNTVINGRPDLKGPLAHLVLGRTGTVYVVAAGLCYHAGTVAEPWQGNSYAIGIEAEATGTDAWPAVQYEAFVQLSRALADHYRVPYSRVLGHKEVAVFPAGHPRAGQLGRKVDPNFPCPDFRRALSAPQEDDMAWDTPIKNAFGDTVRADQILVGTEKRVSDLQKQVDLLKLTGGQVDLDALAVKVADLLATRLRT